MTDINKTLKIKSHTNSQTKLLKQYHQYFDVFDRKKANKLSSLWNEETNHDIKLIIDKNEKAWELSWESLYNMIKNKLLILRKTLMKYLNKNFIWINNFLMTASVLFAKKFDNDLHFCVNYHNLNNITWKNCYSLLLINETFKWIEKVKWFIKLNVITVFYKI